MTVTLWTLHLSWHIPTRADKSSLQNHTLHITQRSDQAQWANTHVTHCHTVYTGFTSIKHSTGTLHPPTGGRPAWLNYSPFCSFFFSRTGWRKTTLSRNIKSEPTQLGEEPVMQTNMPSISRYSEEVLLTVWVCWGSSKRCWAVKLLTWDDSHWGYFCRPWAGRSTTGAPVCSLNTGERFNVTSELTHLKRHQLHEMQRDERWNKNWVADLKVVKVLLLLDSSPLVVKYQ